MNKYLSFAIAGLGIAMATGCSSALSVVTDYDKKVDFSKYKTFALDTLNLVKAVGELNQQRILTSVASAMEAKGFKQQGNGDLLVHVSVVMKEKVAVSSTSYGYGGYYRPYAWNGVLSSYTTYNVSHYNDGSLIIDIADAATKSLVWEGVGNKEMDGPPKNPDAEISAAVNTIMKNFPPGRAAK